MQRALRDFLGLAPPRHAFGVAHGDRETARVCCETDFGCPHCTVDFPPAEVISPFSGRMTVSKMSNPPSRRICASTTPGCAMGTMKLLATMSSPRCRVRSRRWT